MTENISSGFRFIFYFRQLKYCNTIFTYVFPVSEKVSQDEQHQQLQKVEMEVFPGSPGQFLQESPDKSTGQHLVLDPGTTRVCVITSVVVNTPSVVVCSVDVEPCSVLNKSIVSSQALPVSTSVMSDHV